jgi:hypothetical protein
MAASTGRDTLKRIVLIYVLNLLMRQGLILSLTMRVRRNVKQPSYPMVAFQCGTNARYAATLGRILLTTSSQLLYPFNNARLVPDGSVSA